MMPRELLDRHDHPAVETSPDAPPPVRSAIPWPRRGVQPAGRRAARRPPPWRAGQRWQRSGLGLALLLLLLLAPAAVALAAPGSGTATLLPVAPVVAGSHGAWLVSYTAAEDFDPARGGMVSVTIADGWSPPSTGPLVVPGFVEVSASRGGLVDSVTVSGQQVTVHAGAAPGPALAAGEVIYLLYGAQAPAGAARVQSVAPASAAFPVASSPDAALPAVPLAGAPPALAVVPAAPVALHWSPDTLALEAGVARNVRLEARDPYGNPSPPGGPQLLSLTRTVPTLRFLRDNVEIQQLAMPADSAAVALAVRATASGPPGGLRAADGDGVAPALAAAQGSASVAPGAAAALAVSGIDDPLAAGAAATVVVEVLDGYGNRVTDFAGTVRCSASDSSATLPPDYLFQPGDAGLHVFAGAVVLRTAGVQTVSATILELPAVGGAQENIQITAAPAVVLRLSGLPPVLVAGSAADLAVEARDVFDNRATGYRGTVSFTSSDGHAAVVLPGDYTFAAADQGRRLFAAGVVLVTAGSQQVTARDTSDPAISGTQGGIAVAAAAGTVASLSPAGAVPVSAGAARPLVLQVADVYGNPVAGEAATIAIRDPADGSLQPDPAQPGGTQGSSTAQSGLTAAAGTLSVLYQAPASAARTDSAGGWTALIDPDAVAPAVLTSIAGGATQLAWEPAGGTADTAGAAIALRIEARDGYGNVDGASAALVRVTAGAPSTRFSVDGGASWSAGPADSLALAAGSSGTRLLVRDPVAGAPRLAAVDRGGFLAGGDYAGLTILPAPPAGSIPASASPDTLTADGSSELQLAAGPLTDAYGNLLAGALVTVSATAGAVLSGDEDPAPGVQRRTDAAGWLDCAIRAAGAPGVDSIALASLSGAAAGTVTAYYGPRLAFRVEPGSLAPAVAAAGDTVGFTLELRNPGAHGATLGGATRLGLADQDGDRFEALLAAPPVGLPAGAATPLAFSASRLPPALDPGLYTPILVLAGADDRGAMIDTVVAAPVSSFALESLAIESVLAPLAVHRGQSAVPVEVVVANRGDLELLLTDLGLDFSAPAYQLTGVTPPLGQPLPPRASRTYTLAVDVDPLAELGAVAIDAHASASAGGFVLVAPAAAAPSGWQVATAAALTALPGSLGPRAAAAGQRQPAGLVVSNAGGAAVILEPAATRLEFLDGGGSPLLATALAAPALVAGGETVALRFADLEVPAGQPPGIHAARLVAGGSEHGAPFTAILALPDSLRLSAPAVLAVTAGSFAPRRVSRGQQRGFSLTIVNSGGTAIDFENATGLEIGGGALLVPLAVARTVAPGGAVVLDFGPLVLGAALPLGSQPVVVSGAVREAGLPGELSLPVPEPLRVDAAAQPVWPAAGLAPARVTLGQPLVAFALALRNDGGASLTAGLAGTRLAISDGVDSLIATVSGAPLAIAAGATGLLRFAPVTVPAALANQTYAPRLELRFEENGLAGAVTVPAPPGALILEAPAALAYLPQTLAPAVVTPGDSVRFALTVENRGEATARLEAGTVLRVAGIETPLDSLASVRQVAAGDSARLWFAPRRLASATSAGLHAAELALVGIDANGAPFGGDLELGAEALLVVEDGTLRLVTTRSLAPAGHHVNLHQDFAVAVRAVNLGQEDVLDVVISLTGEGLETVTPVAAGTVAAGDTVLAVVPVRAGGTPGAAALAAGVIAGRGALSGEPVLLAPAADDTLALALERPALLDPQLAITAPAGAADGVLSSGSLFTVQLAVDNLGDAAVADGGRLRLEVPAAFGVLGPAEQVFRAGEPLAFAVTAPLAAAVIDSLRVRIVEPPLDRNAATPAALSRAARGLAVTVVEAARLAVQAAIVAPDGALDGRVLPGQEVTIEVGLENAGTAGTLGNGVVEVQLDAELALAAGEPPSRALAVGAPVRWRVLAPAAPSGPRRVAMRLLTAPRDENTGSAAAVTAPQATVALAAIPNPLRARAAPQAAAPPPPLVARGQAGVVAFAFTVLREADGQSGGGSGGGSGGAATLLLDAVTAHVQDRAGAPLAAGRALAELELHRETAAGTLLGSWQAASSNGPGAPAADRARIALALPDTLAGGVERRYVVTLTVAGAADAGSFALELPEHGGLKARDAATGAVLPVAVEAGIRSSTFSLIEAPHNYPNPFAPGRESTHIAYLLERDDRVAVEIFTLLGDRVWSASFAAGAPGGSAGLNEVPWNGRNRQGDTVRNGVYLCRVRGAGLDARWKVAVVR